MAGIVLSSSLEPQATLEELAALIVPDIADWCRVDLLDADGVLQRRLAHHGDPEKSRLGMKLVQSLRAAAGTPGSMAWAMETGLSHLARFDDASAFDAIRDRDLLAFARAIGMRAYFVVPLIARGRTLGAMAVLQAESARAFTQDDCALVAEIAQRAALGLDNAQLYTEAEEARRHAEEASRAKDEFLAMLGHELRNPLAPIVTVLHLMRLRGDSSTVEERRIIERQVAHLSRLVDDLLDVSRIGRGKISLQRERIDLAMVVDKAVELARPLLDRRAGALAIELPSHPVLVHGDAVRLAQVLTNLLTNASKFTPDDGRIALRLIDEGDVAEIRVEDAGSGIAPELLGRVFDVFVQGEQALDRHAGGLGLGLAIVKTLVQLHGGTVSAHSDGPGRGSTFVVRLPRVAASAAVTPAPRGGPADGGGRILVIDANRDAAQTLGMLLDNAGYRVATAADGDHALESLGLAQPDVVIADIDLPPNGAARLAARLRADPRVPGLRLVGLSSDAREGEAGDAAVGFDACLRKPADAQRLLAVLAQLLPR
jgi:signal transduction histidine kinase